MGIKKIEVTRVHTNEEQINEYKSYISGVNSYLRDIEYYEKQMRQFCNEVRMQTTYISDARAMRRELEDLKQKHLIKIGQLTTDGYFKTEKREIVPKISIQKRQFKIGDRVILNIDEVDKVDAKKWGMVGTVVFQGIEIDRDGDNTYVTIRNYVCFDKIGGVKLIYTHELEPLPKKKKPEQKKKVTQTETPINNVLHIKPVSVIYKKGDQVRITGDSIFQMMGFQTVTGKVFVLSDEGKIKSIQCDQTGKIECVTDGQIERI